LQFKQWMQDQRIPQNPWYNDSMYLRFLRAQKFDLEKVQKQFLDYIEYRKEYGLDDLITVRKTANLLILSPFFSFYIFSICYYRDTNPNGSWRCFSTIRKDFTE